MIFFFLFKNVSFKEIIKYNEGEESFTISPKFTSYELMQYTGLKDKNGKEIYEGDIVKCLRPNNFKDKEIIIVKIPTLGKYSDFMNIIEIEVIGNIYEHPELLTKGDT